MIRLIGIFLLTAMVGSAATHRIDFTPGYAYVVKVRADRPASIYVARITKGKLKRIPQTASLNDEGQFSIICSLESQSDDGTVLIGFASLHGEITLTAGGIPEIDDYRGGEPLRPAPPSQPPTRGKGS